VAQYGAARGAKVVAITSLLHSHNTATRHSTGKRLADIADIVIDTGVPAGDAIVGVQGTDHRAGSASTVLGAAILSSVVAQTAHILTADALSVPVLVSANVTGGDEHNRNLADRYWKRLTKFPRRGAF